MQPIAKDSRGVIRFHENRIVRYLLDKATEAGFGLNHMAEMRFAQDDWTQFYQLIGYSLAGFHELSLVPDSACLEASRLAREAFGNEVGGCRDDGCKIHCGVEEDDSSQARATGER